MDHRIELHIAAEHPSFAGHFLGHPILPGVVLLSKVIAAINSLRAEPLSAYQLEVVKFLKPVKPDSHLQISLQSLAEQRIRFSVLDGKDSYATGIVCIDHSSPA